MTANELADKIQYDIELYIETDQFIFDECANMLRQQAKEIENLRTELALQKLSDIGQAIENEPVAWISVLGIDHIGQKFTDVRVSLTKTDVADIPLYTHPMRELTEDTECQFCKQGCIRCDARKLLTDEELESAYWSLVGKQHEGKIASYLYNFARDILQKANEK